MLDMKLGEMKMARIPEAEIERLKQELSLQRLVESAGIALKRHSADHSYMGAKLAMLQRSDIDCI